ncbi:MAG: KamA family radical SAM protein [Sandaracinaceae bacterium]|nr:KamA family radical SAM protein [Sandaracinaceae bacterium]
MSRVHSSLPLLVQRPSVLGPSSDADAAPGHAAADDWRVQAREAVTTLEGLEAALQLTPSEREGAARALAGGFPMSVTPYYLGLASKTDPACPIRRQCVPVASEGHEVPGDLRDPLGEEAHEVAPHLVQRYPDRVLLLATDRCAVYCRFCTRSRMVGDGGGARSLDALAEAFAYIESHPEVQEVIVSGGDPLVMSTGRIARLFERLARIEHLTNVRLATRAPVTIPQRITDELVQALRAAHPSIWVMTHFNHPQELTPESTAALARLVDGGFPVMNQAVLLRGVNDSADTLEALFRGLVKRRVRPYYLLQMDPVRGTGHLRTPLSTGVDIMGALQGRLSGIALPKFIVDTPNGRGKVPVGPETVVARGEGSTTLRTFRGELVDYIDPPG